MLGMNNKKMATIIMGRIKPSGPSSDKPDFVQKIGERSSESGVPDMESDLDPSSTGLETAMDDFISAVHSKDASGATDAFKALFDIYESMPEEDDDEDEEGTDQALPPVSAGSESIKDLVRKKLGK